MCMHMIQTSTLYAVSRGVPGATTTFYRTSDTFTESTSTLLERRMVRKLLMRVLTTKTRQSPAAAADSNFSAISAQESARKLKQNQAALFILKTSEIH